MKNGKIIKLKGIEVQLIEGKRSYPKFNHTLLPAGVLSALNGATGPLDVAFHTDPQQKLVQGTDSKYLIWLPGEEEPAIPEPRRAAPSVTPPQAQAAGRNQGRHIVHGGGHGQPVQQITHDVDDVREIRNKAGMIEKLTIVFHREMTVRVHGQEQQVTTQQNTNFQVTDPVLAFRQGARFCKAGAGENPGHVITQFAPGMEMPTGLRGAPPTIDRNPYNFVSLPGNAPWYYKPEHPHHASWLANHHSGVLEFTATAETPLFVPEGFPFSSKGDPATDEGLRNISRRFCRMKRADGKEYYAVPGSTLKGVLRSGVEALSNSRMGVLNKEYYEKKIPYRRRCYNDIQRGKIQTGIVENVNGAGDFSITRIKETYIKDVNLDAFKNVWGGGAQPACNFSYDEIQRDGRNLAVPGTTCRANKGDVYPYRANLMNEYNSNHHYSHRIVTRQPGTLILENRTVKAYHDHLNHPHVEAHWKEYLKTPPAYPGPNKPRYSAAVTSFAAVKDALQLKVGDIIYFTDDGTKITSFGKNVNYLWPAKHAIADLIREYILPGKLSLADPLSMAERLFGFAGDHKKENGKIVSHPYRSRLRFETLWGPEVDPGEENWPDDDHIEADKHGFKVKLAALTAPQARAKARPLYLEPGNEGRSASYSDTSPQMRGRKFYWHQKAEEGGDGIWAIHKRHAYHEPIAKQLPPEIRPLKKGTMFTGRIHFDNLTDEELGALIYALQGDGSYRHGVKLGKGKPRGLGSLAIKIGPLALLKPEERYRSLTGATGNDVQEEAVLTRRIEDFKTWCKARSGNVDFDRQDHIEAYKNLHTLPAAPSARYYPLHFRDYSWLPAENSDPDEPKYPATRPRAMKRAGMPDMNP
jgi:CRISPR-associated protein (TIGR03986 family)